MEEIVRTRGVRREKSSSASRKDNRALQGQPHHFVGIPRHWVCLLLFAVVVSVCCTLHTCIARYQMKCNTYFFTFLDITSIDKQAQGETKETKGTSKQTGYPVQSFQKMPVLLRKQEWSSLTPYTHNAVLYQLDIHLTISYTQTKYEEQFGFKMIKW